jgi:hypothetical protein
MSDERLAIDAAPAPSGAAQPLPARWATLPRYLHFFTLGYFLTNFFNIWAYNRMAPHPIVGVLAVVGFVGGLAEHITPYFPRLTIPVMAEKILFRVPTILASFFIFFSLDPWLPWTALITGWAVYFWRAPALSSLELGFHLRHFGATHIGGSLGTVAWLMVYSGSSPLLTRIYSAPFG